MAKEKIGGWTVLVIALILYAVIPGVNTAVNNFIGGLGLAAPAAVTPALPSIPCPKAV